MNRLIHETSPYLLQHAHNPVDWYPWGPEAFAAARREGKPIIVSIGYSTCHWCHVMERESFEDADTAAFMNEHFINIKVDREERPDVDHVYMQACLVISGNGGWPLNCFLLPDGRPIYAGTYYPPMPMSNRPSWLQMLNHIYQTYTHRRGEAEAQAEQLTQAIQNGNRNLVKTTAMPAAGEPLLDAEWPARVAAQLQQRFDPLYGGFGGAPKFPGTMSLNYLLDFHRLSGEAPAAMEHVHHSLQQMIGGGIYDQLGGGFARYTVDRAWRVPHFEKMLYDNALLVSLLAKVHRFEPQAVYRATISETLAFVERELYSPEGAFLSALDADSEGEEGKFYVWSAQEIDDILGGDAPFFKRAFGVLPGGNWEGTNILWRAVGMADLAEGYNSTEADIAMRIQHCKTQLLAARAPRTRPGLDDKIILSWNALMISAYAQAYLALGDEHYLTVAEDAWHFIAGKMLHTQGTRIWHTYKAGQARYEGFLDDYALLCSALIDLFEAAQKTDYLLSAQTLCQAAIDLFHDPSDGHFFYTPQHQNDLPTRTKELFDSATPSGNSAMLHNLIRLSGYFDKADWMAMAQRMVLPLKDSMAQYPQEFGHWASACLWLLYPRQEVAIVGNHAVEHARQLQAAYHPLTLFMASDRAFEEWPLLAGRDIPSGETRIFVCQDYQCQLPVATVEEALNIMRS